ALADCERTAAWDEARRGATVVVGGRAAVFLPLPDLRAVVVLDEGDEAFQQEGAPTWHAREVAVERAARVGASVTLVSPTPSVDARAAGNTFAAPSTHSLRAGWPRLDLVDQRDDEPGRTLLSSALGPALHRAVDGGGRAICVVNRRGRARILACRAWRRSRSRSTTSSVRGAGPRGRRCARTAAPPGSAPSGPVCRRCATTSPR